MKELMSIDFYGDRIYLAEVNGEPYVPVKPICENLGIAWQAQHAKLSSDRKRWNCHDIVIVAQDGKLREMLCIPLRKLPAWLYSISPEKVKPEVREKLLLYQEECDRVLWDYWMKGVAVNPRKAAPSFTLEDIRRVVREEMRGLCAQDEQALSLARGYGYFLGVKAALEVVRRYEQCNLRRRPASFLLSLMRYEAMGLQPWEIRRLLRCSRDAVRRGRKKLRELGISSSACQLPLFQKTNPQKEVI